MHGLSLSLSLSHTHLPLRAPGSGGCVCVCVCVVGWVGGCGWVGMKGGWGGWSTACSRRAAGSGARSSIAKCMGATRAAAACFGCEHRCEHRRRLHPDVIVSLHSIDFAAIYWISQSSGWSIYWISCTAPISVCNPLKEEKASNAKLVVPSRRRGAGWGSMPRCKAGTQTTGPPPVYANCINRFRAKRKYLERVQGLFT